MANNGTIAMTLPHLGVAAVGTKANAGAAAITLSHLGVSAAGRIGISQSGTIAMTLSSVQVAASGGKHTAVFSITLQSIAISAHGHSGVDKSGTAAITLPKLTVVGVCKDLSDVPNEISVVTGLITSLGSGIFQFKGRTNVGVSWAITVGTGAIAAYSDYTDERGQAFAKYDAGGYAGPLTISVSYVP